MVLGVLFVLVLRYRVAVVAGCQQLLGGLVELLSSVAVGTGSRAEGPNIGLDGKGGAAAT